MTLDEFRTAVLHRLTTKFGDRLDNVTFMTDSLHVRPRWMVFARIDGRPPTSFPFAAGPEPENNEQFQEFMKRVISVLSGSARTGRLSP